MGHIWGKLGNPEHHWELCTSTVMWYLLFQTWLTRSLVYLDSLELPAQPYKIIASAN